MITSIFSLNLTILLLRCFKHFTTISVSWFLESFLMPIKMVLAFCYVIPYQAYLNFFIILRYNKLSFPITTLTINYFKCLNRALKPFQSKYSFVYKLSALILILMRFPINTDPDHFMLLCIGLQCHGNEIFMFLLSRLDGMVLLISQFTFY